MSPSIRNEADVDDDHLPVVLQDDIFNLQGRDPEHAEVVANSPSPTFRVPGEDLIDAVRGERELAGDGRIPILYDQGGQASLNHRIIDHGVALHTPALTAAAA